MNEHEFEFLVVVVDAPITFPNLCLSCSLRRVVYLFAQPGLHQYISLGQTDYQLFSYYNVIDPYPRLFHAERDTLVSQSPLEAVRIHLTTVIGTREQKSSLVLSLLVLCTMSCSE